MQLRQLGKCGPLVSMVGLGCMGMSGTYGPSDRAEGLRTIGAALDAGINLLDTGDFYGMGHNELLIQEALSGGRREQVRISLKFGAMREPGGGWVGYDARPAAVRNFLAYSLRRLGTDYVDIYRPARLDPAVPIEETVGAMADLVKAGYVRAIGLSEVGVQTLRRAASVHPICDLQIEYSLISRGIESAILPACRSMGIAITAYGILSRGLISGHWTRTRQPGDWRAASPRFTGENLDTNLALAARLGAIAARAGLSAAQLAIAWVLARGEDIVPLIGARRPEQLAESLGALDRPLPPAILAELDDAFPPGVAAGDRYPPRFMAQLDSEAGAPASGH